jgi:hypothetical protein
MALPVSFSQGAFSRLETQSKLPPHWAGVRVAEATQGHQVLVPGDTKVSSKWQSGLERATRKSEKKRFKDVLRQVVHYCSIGNLRYGFVITDKELYCFRRTKSPTHWILCREEGCDIQLTASDDDYCAKICITMSLYRRHPSHCAGW